MAPSKGMDPARWQAIERLFHAAHERPVPERAPFLAQACAGDAALRHEVELLLAQAASADGFLEAAALSAAGRTHGPSVLTGRRLGVYEVREPIGAGGMGEVYRARDTKLGRDVAIKILPAGLTSDPDRLARFQREGRVLAALNHPNIATIHGIEESDGIRALVMELVEGATLAERIARRPVPVREALDIARQLADALDAAHEKGIIHRDLKPANIKITPSGTVKVLDFGLAKVTARDGTASQAPTVTIDCTRDGLIMGTVAYMSPEQARGHAVDKRTDIWAFGCVLFEMLSGEPAFSAATLSDTIAKILERQPDFASLPPTTPTRIVQLLKRAFEKDPRQRLRDIGDAKAELTESGAMTSTPAPTSDELLPVGWRPRRAGAWIVGAAATGAVATMLVQFAWRVFSASDPTTGATHPIRFTVDISEGTTQPTEQGAISPPMVSPDGHVIAWVGRGADGVPRLWVRSLDAAIARELAGTDGATYPFWSPDGRALGFYADTKLKRINITGGSVQVLADTALVSLGGTWNSQGVIVYSSRYGLYRIPASGGAPTLVATLDRSRQENSLRFPQFLPDGRHFLYVARSGRPANNSAYMGSLDGPPVRLFASLSNVLYSPPGYLLFTRERTLVARHFDPETLTLGSEVGAVVEGVGSNSLSMVTFASVSANGVLAYNSFDNQRHTLRWFDRAGRALDSMSEEVSVTHFRIAPDDRRVVAALQDYSAGTRSLWIFDPARPPRRLTFAATHDWEPVWSPDGTRVAFASYRDGPLNLYTKAATGSGGDEPLFISENQKDIGDWSADGRFLAFRMSDDTGRGDIEVLELDGKRTTLQVTTTASEERDPRFAPDGRWIAYESDETGRSEIYVAPFPPTGAKWQVSSGGGRYAAWRGDGRELFFVADNMVTAVPVEGNETLEFGPPKGLFRLPARGGTAETQFDVTRDGQRFLVRVPVSESPSTPINVVVNWGQLLQKP